MLASVLDEPELPPLAFSPDRTRFLVGGPGLCMWSVDEGRKLGCPIDKDTRVSAVAWGAKSAAIVTDKPPKVRLLGPDDLR